MTTKDKVIAILASLALIALSFIAFYHTAQAASVSWDRPIVGRINPINLLDTVFGNIFTATSTTAASTFPYASTTVISGARLCIGADCRSVWPTTGSTFAYPFPLDATSTKLTFSGGLTTTYASTTGLSATFLCLSTDCRTSWPSGGGGGNISTSSVETSARVPFWTSTSATPATLSGGSAGFVWDNTNSKLTATNASTTAATVSSALYNTYLTGSRVPFTGGNGLLTDNGDLVFSSGTISNGGPKLYIGQGNVTDGSTDGSLVLRINTGSGNIARYVLTGIASGNATNTIQFPASSGTVCLTTTCASTGYPFALTGNATSTLTQFNGGLTAYATSTIGAGGQTTGLTISGGATTTGTLVASGGVSLPGSAFTQTGSSVFSASNVATAFTTSLFNVSAPTATFTGGAKVGIGTSTPGTELSVNGTAVIAGPVTSQYFLATSTLTASTFPYASTTAISASGSAYFATTGGNVGIGTTTPKGALAVLSSAAQPQLSLTDGSLTSTQWVFANYGGTLNISTSSPSTYATSTPSALSIASQTSTQVGIATTTPWRTLSVTGTVGFDGLTAAAGTVQGLCIVTATKEIVVNSAASCVTSSRKFKHNIVPLTDYITQQLMAVPTYSFVYNDSPTTLRYGFMAEDTATVNKSLADYDSQGEPTSVDTTALLALTVKNVQEQESKIALLQKRDLGIQDSWQWLAIVLLTLGMLCQQMQLWKLKNA